MQTATKLAPLVERVAWKGLQTHSQEIREKHLRDLFAADPARGERFTAEAAGIFLDFSKNRITDETLKLLIGLAEESGLREKIEATLAGQPDVVRRKVLWENAAALYKVEMPAAA